MAKPFRILHCLRAPVGGLFRHVLDLTGEQARLGYDVGIIADSSTGDTLTAERFSGIEPELKLGLHRIEMSRRPGIGDAFAAAATRRIAAQSGANILHGHGAKGGAFARLAAASLKAVGTLRPGCFYTPHGGTLHFSPSSAEGIFYFGAERLLAKATDGIIFESAFSKRTYEEKVGLRGRPARVIPNGLAGQDFVRAVPDEDAADFLFVGELLHLKGVDVLLEALRALNESRPVSAVIVGAGTEADVFKELAHRFRLDGKVRFPGAMPARAAFSLGHTIIVPSRAESFPYIVLEAAAAGLPVIATDVGGIPEIVAGTDTHLVPPGDAGALAARMSEILSDPAKAKAQAENLRTAVERQFTIAGMTATVLAFYASALTVH